MRIAGLEPARVAPLPPQSSVSANSTICARPDSSRRIFAAWPRRIVNATRAKSSLSLPPPPNDTESNSTKSQAPAIVNFIASPAEGGFLTPEFLLRVAGPFGLTDQVAR